MMEKDNILEVKNLKKYFVTPKGLIHAVDDVTFNIKKGETLGVVGESGCGKSTLGRTILRLHEPTSGEVWFDGENILKYNTQQMKKTREKMQIVFQDPFAHLNPRMTIRDTIVEPLIVQKKFSRKDKENINKKVVQIMDMVGLAQRLINTYPHELDGGRRQRIGIARVLALNPMFIVCDEPVSALDVSIQAQILNLLQDLQDELNLTYLFITHDLSVVKHISNNIVVMYLGQVVEKAPTGKLFLEPLHPYTQALLSAIPVPSYDYKIDRIILKGELTSPINPEKGCRFAKRCLYAEEDCFNTEQELRELEDGHFVACNYAIKK